ncbi:MAG: xanthine dehydrogenase family protein subunit M [Burkholderiaceae bacterium]
MKAAAFEYQRADDISQALILLDQDETGLGKVLGGGQSLGPMMNLRLVQPNKLIDVSLIRELSEVTAQGESLRIGAGVRHAQIEDGQLPDVTNGLLTHVAGGIAHRAVRNRGTLGGSLVHADPSADWVSVMSLINARLLLQSSQQTREIAAADFFIAAFTTAIQDDEVLVAIDVPQFSTQARWAYKKICRKPGEFADALAAVWIDPAHDIHRAVIGALSTPPYVINGLAAIQALRDDSGLNQALDQAGITNPVDRQRQSTMLGRALDAVGLSAGGAS